MMQVIDNARHLYVEAEKETLQWILDYLAEEKKRPPLQDAAWSRIRQHRLYFDLVQWCPVGLNGSSIGEWLPSWSQYVSVVRQWFVRKSGNRE